MTEFRRPSTMVVGSVLAGRYRVDEWVMPEFEKATWRGVDTEVGRTVGVRVPRYSAQGYSAIDSFRAQFELLSAIDHPGVMRVYAVGTDPAADAYLITEHIEPLPQVRDGPLPPEDAMDFVAQVADALAAVHDSGVVYRNVTRGVLRRADGTFVLFDFHRARRADSPDPASRTVSIPGDGPAAASTDIHDLGVGVYFSLTGRRPQPDLDNPYAPPPWERPRGRRGQPPPPLVPLGVQSVVDRMLAYRPEDRWPTASALADAARSALT
jgi:eukaryotic-like serine/threonine-protein kinase